ncbi:serine protease [Luteibacter sp.]|uniref:serine protease n=1 Tax=Luteibacter sp. TaxID=1886636 RepID=UPI0028096C87|nr:serine protease [Luteibacter sp.]MDQ8048100.1 serine protease [Luteibacter sp.]
MKQAWRWFKGIFRRPDTVPTPSEAPPFVPFRVPAFETWKVPEKVRPVDPGVVGIGKPFHINDPFGLRRAIVPVLTTNGEGPYGIGTAFMVDGWNTYLTADHVVDFIRQAMDSRKLQPGEPIPALTPQTMPPAYVLLGVGMVFGTVPIPSDAFAQIYGIGGILAEQGDPMKEMHGIGPDKPMTDLATVHVMIGPDAPRRASLPLRIKGWVPTVGETVLAIGFPRMGFAEPDLARMTARYDEEMMGVYGTISEVFPDGRGREYGNPGFEVIGDWPSGMSGGPVINSAGEVVGVVSRSTRPDADGGGVGYAIWLGADDMVEGLLPQIDPEEPGVRRGYAVLPGPGGENTREGAFVADRAHAAWLAENSPTPATVHEARHRLGEPTLDISDKEASPDESAPRDVLTKVTITSRGIE